MKPRISIAGLLGVVALCGLACASLKYATPLVAGTVYTVTGVVLVFAAYRAIRGKRPFWLGFALSGWAHLAFAFSNLDRAPWLLTVYVDHVANSWLSGGLAEVRKVLEAAMVAEDGAPIFNVVVSLMTLVVACAGGLIASWSARRRGMDLNG